MANNLGCARKHSAENAVWATMDQERQTSLFVGLALQNRIDRELLLKC